MTDIRKKSAETDEVAISLWNDWCAFLRLHLELLDLRSAPAGDIDAFEISDSSMTREEDIRQQIAIIPPSSRVIFETEVEKHRQVTQMRLDGERRAKGNLRQILDAELVERESLQELLDEAKGTYTDGMGSFPMDVEDWYSIDLQTLHNVPDIARYSLRNSRKTSRGRVVAGVAVLVFGVGFFFLSQPKPNALKATSSSIVVNDQAIVLWQPRIAKVTGGETKEFSIVLAGSQTNGVDQAQWKKDTLPLSICIPGSTKGIQRVDLIGSGDAPNRIYQVQQSTSKPDLVLTSCDGKGESVYGWFQSSEPSKIYDIGQSGQFQDGRTISVQTIEVLGAGQDTKLPVGKAQVIVTVHSSSITDWSHLNMVLRWPDAQDILPSVTTGVEDGVQLKYLVPVFDSLIDIVEIRISDPESKEMLFWKSSLNAPLNRSQILSEVLKNVNLKAEKTTSGALHMVLSVHNTGKDTLKLSESDIEVKQDNRRIALPALSSLQEPLKPDETRDVDIVMNANSGSMITISIASSIFQISN